MKDAKWIIEPLTPEQEAICERLADELAISRLSASILVRRGLTTASLARSFIRPRLEDLHDPYLMKGMREAIDRIDRAIAEGEKILIFGDYDVDGTTAVSLIYKFFRPLCENLDFYIPDRYLEGYGISFRGIDYAVEHGCTLIIALDCGIKSVDKVAYAAKQGVDFIICDHHMPGDELPEAVAVLDPHREDDTYPYRELCGCGVGFKLAQAYAIRHEMASYDLLPLLELTAMSIASDIVPITGENRILAYFGLREINKKPSVGLQSIMNMAGIHPGRLTISDLVYKIGPRVNACGRIKSGTEAVKLLITEDADMAAAMSEAVNDYNKSRQDKDKSITEEALQQLQADPENAQKHTTVVFAPHWHKGVVGIVASRLVEAYYKPAVVLTKSNGFVTGSARSVQGFDLYQSIDSCADLLENFGGHVYAAGLTMKEENLAEFCTRMDRFVGEHLTEEMQVPVVDVDAVLDFARITPKFFRILKQFQPFGPGNGNPVFVTENVYDSGAGRKVGAGGLHLKLDLIQESQPYRQIPAIAFNMAGFYDYIREGNPFDVCYSIVENYYRGNATIQLRVRDIHEREGDII